MKKSILFFFLLLIFSQKKIVAQSTSLFSNDICLPSKQYMLNGIQNDMFIQSFLKRWRPYNDFVRFSGTATYLRRYEKVASIKNAQSGQTMKVELINSDSFNVLKTIESTILVGEPSVGNAEIAVQFLGDSYTRAGAYFKATILGKGYVPNVKCVGLRAIPDYKGQFNEGRGGWTLEKYFSNDTENPLFFNPFFQPEEKYKYWGSTVFWKTAIGVNNKTIKNQPNSIEPSYSCDGYDASMFNEDGLLLHPKKEDMMFDSEHKTYIFWNGHAWIKMQAQKLSWSFQYDKYLAMWNLQPPKILIVMLGLNDFRNGPMPADFKGWNAKVELLLASYKRAVPDGKLVVCTPIAVVAPSTIQRAILPHFKMRNYGKSAETS